MSPLNSIEIPVVSVCMISYNHEEYIAEAIEGVLMQKTNFPIKLIIGEDYSTDNTRIICQEYANNFPDLIELLPKEKTNLGMMPNFIRTLNSCKGKYIAICEGDDYWTDPLKLQRQVDFLEENHEYSGAAHQAQVVYENSTKTSNLFKKGNPSTIKLDSLLEGRLFHTASFIFRTELIKKHTLPSNITAGDRALFLLVASFGKIHYSNEVMCCYRKNEGGISTWVTSDRMEKDLNIVPWIKSINPKFPKHRYYAFIHHTILTYPKYLSKSKAIKHSFWHIIHSFYKFPNNIKSTAIFILYEFPKIWRKTQTPTL